MMILKCVWIFQGPRTAEANVKNNKTEEQTSLCIKTYCNTTLRRRAVGVGTRDMSEKWSMSPETHTVTSP